jgi:hypothetical protein
MMLPSRKLAVMFVCVFLLGGVAGALAYINFADFRFYDFLSRTNDPGKLARRIDGKLLAQYKLTADEQARISPLTKKMALKLYTIRHQFAVDVLSTIDASHAEIAAQMDPGHREAYIKDNLDRHQRAASMLMPVSKAASGTTGADGSHP